ncbi:MAG: DUF1565 domain-containing protein [Deltaproteobacteria bacterium]|nr:DUF1565 domain-containing protein [Deltaproteobacteria bacterium]
MGRHRAGRYVALIAAMMMGLVLGGASFARAAEVDCYPDQDGDGQGDDAASTMTFADACPLWWTQNNDDCDDTDFNIHDGAPELPDNGIDENCDGADFEISDSNAIFVSPSGSDSDPGTKAAPKKTILGALDAAGGDEVIVLAAGTYDGHFNLDRSLFGGYDDSDGWSRDIDANESKIVADATGDKTIYGSSGTAVAIQGVTVEGRTVDSGGSKTISLSSLTAHYRVDRVRSISGDGGTFTRGIEPGGMITSITNSYFECNDEDTRPLEMASGTQRIYIAHNTFKNAWVGATLRPEVLSIFVQNEVTATPDAPGSVKGGVTIQGSGANVVANNLFLLDFRTVLGVDNYSHEATLYAVNNTMIVGKLEGGPSSFLTAFDLLRGNSYLADNIVVSNGATTDLGIRAQDAIAPDDRAVWAYNNLFDGDSNFCFVQITDPLDPGEKICGAEDLSAFNACGWKDCDTAADNLTGDPLFVGGGDYHLQHDFAKAAGPAIDAGIDPNTWLSPLYADIDFDGETRPYNDAYDIGYDEAQPLTTDDDDDDDTDDDDAADDDSDDDATDDDADDDTTDDDDASGDDDDDDSGCGC